MVRSRSSLGFPRKVVVYYLLFCLLAVSWLTIGVLYTAHTVSESRTTSSCLSRLGKTAAALELAYLRGGVSKLQEVLEGSKDLSNLKYLAVISVDGKILAHSDVLQIDQPYVEPQGNQLRWGKVSGTQYENAQGQSIHEYRVDLVAHEDHFGSLRIGSQQLNFWSALQEIGRVAPFGLLLPLVLIGLGAVFLARLTSPLAKVDQQLRRIARQRPAVDLILEKLPTKDAISIGWNRIAEAMASGASDAVATDLQQRIADAVAVRQQGELHKVFQSLSDGIAVTDLEGRIRFANRAVAALLGTEVTAEDLVGLELEEQILRTFGSEACREFENSGTGFKPKITELMRSEGDGQRSFRVARLPLTDEGEPGYLWSVRDITQQKLSEKSRDQFIDAATHELRTPLSNIKAYAETLATAKGIEVEQQKEFCNIINSEVTRLARFVDDLLSISSIEAGSILIDKQRTIATRLFEEVLDKVRPLMKQKEQTFEVKMPEKMPDLYVDKDKIVAVLVNLLGNAAKYTPSKGRVSMRVKVDNENLQVAIEDTGVGIAPDEVSKVFEKFFRSSDPRVQTETGTGLGLALAQEVVHMHGGTIAVESQLDQGTTFAVTVPIR